jgi:L,D-peptidoglycan transpeptidase YkuD (ErfK/YbiS/YcfS/YnhG family)
MFKSPCFLSPPYTHLIFENQTFPCTIGRGGVIGEKREGDGGTPVGSFAFRAVYYRPDREEAPTTHLPLFAITPDAGWCDDPVSPGYNRPVILPSPHSAESLWRQDACYDLIIVMGHNDAPAYPNRGSALFVHLPHADGRPTAGCVALNREDLRALLRGGCGGVVIEN